MNEETITIDYKNLELRRTGYRYTPGNPPEFDRGLGLATFRAKVLRFDRPIRIDKEFPWSTEDREVFELADCIHLLAFRKMGWRKHFQWVFGIGNPRQHGAGLMVGVLGGQDVFGGDTYLPSWIVGPPDPRRNEESESEGFPPGVGFLVVSRVS